MSEEEKRQIKELCDRAILSFMSIDQVINVFENNTWFNSTLASGDFVINIEFLNCKRKKEEIRNA